MKCKWSLALDLVAMRTHNRTEAASTGLVRQYGIIKRECPVRRAGTRGGPSSFHLGRKAARRLLLLRAAACHPSIYLWFYSDLNAHFYGLCVRV